MTDTSWKDSKREEPVERLWSEYSYRHSHIWRVVYQATAAVVALSVVPYLETAQKAGLLKFLPLVIAVALAAFTYPRIKREFLLFNVVKTEYLSRTRDPAPDAESSSFERHTLRYLWWLATGPLGHSLILVAALICPAP